jgi:hypothetical protein
MYNAVDNMFKFTLVESGKSAYTNLASKDSNTMYAIPETKEIFFGEELIASENVEIVDTLPDAGKADKIYVVTTGDDKGFYSYNTTDAKFEPVVSFNGITVANLASSAVQTTVRAAENAVDTALPTEKAVRTELDTKVDKVEGKGLSANDFTDTLKDKLDGIAENANNYTHPDIAVAVTADTAYNKVTFDSTGHVATATAETTLAGLGITDAYTKTETDNKISEVVNGISWKEAVATFDDIATTYTNPKEGWTVSVADTNIVYRYDEASASWSAISSNAVAVVEASTDGAGGKNGLMTAAMAEKLNGIADKAEVNQNAVSAIKVGTTTITTTTKTDTVEIKSGDDISVTADADNKTITIASTYTHPDSGVSAGTYNKVTVDAQGHVTAATAESTLSGLGVTGTTQDITLATGYEKGTVADVAATDTLNAALGKLEAKADAKVNSSQIITTLDSSATDTQLISAKAVYDLLKVERI